LLFSIVPNASPLPTGPPAWKSLWLGEEREGVRGLHQRKENLMEKRTQLSVILTNTPGELAKLCDVLKASNVNILAMSIQNAKDSVKELYNMREKTERRIALVESYRGILKDSSDYSLIRLLVDKPTEAEKALLKANHLIDKHQVLVFRLVNEPGVLGRVAKSLGEANVNIDYIYGSAMEQAKESIFVVHIAESDLSRVENSFRDL
jgi:hypothetical protein